MLAGLGLAGCVTPRPVTPRTVEALASLPNVMVEERGCPGGMVKILQVPTPGAEETLDYRLMLAPTMGRYILMDYHASRDDKSTWRVVFGTLTPAGALTPVDTLTIEQASAKYPSPCDYLYPGTAL